MTVLNKYHHNNTVPDGSVNIMRGSLFGNPFIIGKDGTREEVILKYKHWLYKRVREDQEFYRLVESLYHKDLCCCCAPLACHGDVLEACSEWMNREKENV